MSAFLGRVLLGLCALELTCRCCQKGVCILERACWCRCGVLLRMRLSEGRALELACWCCCSVPLQGAVLKRRVRFGVGMLVPLQGAVAGCCCQSVRFGASVLLQGAAVWSSVYPVELACTVPLQGAGGGYYCQRAVCILGTWVLLQGVAVRVRCVL